MRSMRVAATSFIIEFQVEQPAFDVGDGASRLLPAYLIEKRWMVVCVYGLLGSSTVLGKFGWFGESGKC